MRHDKTQAEQRSGREQLPLRQHLSEVTVVQELADCGEQQHAADPERKSDSQELESSRHRVTLCDRRRIGIGWNGWPAGVHVAQRFAPSETRFAESRLELGA